MYEASDKAKFHKGEVLADKGDPIDVTKPMNKAEYHENEAHVKEDEPIDAMKPMIIHFMRQCPC